jgi:hypothetical protein
MHEAGIRMDEFAASATGTGLGNKNRFQNALNGPGERGQRQLTGAASTAVFGNPVPSGPVFG